MKQNVLMVLAGIACMVMIAVAGCTSSTGSAAAATPAATTEVTAAAAETTAQPVVTATAVAKTFVGDWNTTWKSGNDTPLVTSMTLVEDNTTVAGTYIYANVTGSIKGTVEGSVLTGTWKETSPDTTYSGPVVLILSADGNSFTGKWANDSDAADAINTTTDYWNGVRV